MNCRSISRYKGTFNSGLKGGELVGREKKRFLCNLRLAKGNILFNKNESKPATKLATYQTLEAQIKNSF